MITRATRWSCIAFVCSAMIGTLAQCRAAAAGDKPNIVVIVADDLGYAEVAFNGEQPIPTPRIRSIATSGVAFSNGYVTCPVCSPTRAGLITGRYQQRTGHEFNPGPAGQADDVFGLALDQVTLADRLKKLGYETGMVGKWHLGYKSEFHPLKRGFDEFFGFLGGAHSYVNSAADPANLILRGTRPVEETDHLSDAFGREAVAYIERHKQHPFFLYLTFNAVHAPLESPERFKKGLANIADERRRTFAGMLMGLDENVGIVLDKLSQEKLIDNTLIFFIADNGGPTLRTSSGNAPLRGYKGQVWEGGIRVPYLVQWKAKLPQGKVYDRPVSSLDIVPTAVAAAGGSLSGETALDGVDLVPYLTGANDQRPHEALYWRFGPQWAIRLGDYKLLQPPEGPAQLVDLASDVGEEHDLSAEKPEVRKKLEAAYADWNSQLTSPRWKAQRAARAGQARRNGRARAKAKANEL